MESTCHRKGPQLRMAHTLACSALGTSDWKLQWPRHRQNAITFIIYSLYEEPRSNSINIGTFTYRISLPFEMATRDVLTTSQIEHIMKKCKITRPYFHGVYALDELPTEEIKQKPAIVICNTAYSHSSGSIGLDFI